MDEKLMDFMWYEGIVQIERKLLSDSYKTNDVVHNRMLDDKESTQK